MGWLDRLDPTSRKAVLFGIPLVALAALVASMRGARATPADEETKPDVTVGMIPGADAGAVNVGELGTALSEVGDLLYGLPQAIKDQLASDRPTTPAAPAKTWPAAKTHTTAAGQTLGNIAAFAYARYDGANARAWGYARIRSANASLASKYGPSGRLPAGVRVVLPAPPHGW